MDKRLIGALSFAGGVIIGANWHRITKCVKPQWAALKNKVTSRKAERKTEVRQISVRVKAPAKKPAKKIAAAKPQGMEENVLAALKNAPKGKSLAELGSALGVHFIRVASSARRLVDEGKIRKKGNVYILAA